jgi:hypothetical protein
VCPDREGAYVSHGHVLASQAVDGDGAARDQLHRIHPLHHETPVEPGQVALPNSQQRSGPLEWRARRVGGGHAGGIAGEGLRWTLGLTHRVDALRSLTKGDLERGANVLMFIPAGLLLCHLLAPVPRVLVWVLCVLTSCDVEFARTVSPGRQPFLVDIATNSTGAAIGVLIHAILSSRPPSSPERAER